MELQKVKSSLLSAMFYDEPGQLLYVEFLRRGNEEKRRIYCYSGINSDKYKAMMASESIGSYFLRYIKPNHPCKRIEEAHEEEKAHETAPGQETGEHGHCPGCRDEE
jgi:hypothetical protein